MNIKCPECQVEPVAYDDYICRTCRLAQESHAVGETVIYHGDMYRGNILDCKVSRSWDDKAKRGTYDRHCEDRGVLLQRIYNRLLSIIAQRLECRNSSALLLLW